MGESYEVSILSKLGTLERDRIFALDAAIHGAGDGVLRSHLQDFRAEHAADLRELDEAMCAKNATPPVPETARGLRVEVRVAADALVGDDGMLGRILESEDEVIDAYSAAASDAALGGELRRKLAAMAERERTHRQWMQEWLADRY